MSELELLEDALDDVFTRERAADAGLEETWARLESAGLTLVGVPEALGGAGGDPAQAAAVARLCGLHAVALPIPETALLAGWLLAGAGLSVPVGPLTAASGELAVERSSGGTSVRGSLWNVPQARVADHLVVLAGGLVLVVPAGSLEIEPGVNVASEPRDTVRLDVVVPAERTALSPVGHEALRERGALVRACQTAGALERVLELTVRQVCEREQFGRPLGRFQAVQQQVAVLAGEAAAARAAVDLAVACPSRLATAIAKTRAGEAATSGAKIAHQLHGAIGVTEEHELHRFTLRLLAWRDEYGNEREWAAVIGREVAGRDLWECLDALRTAPVPPLA